jgi:iron complex outermembrane recepter protein
MRISPRANRPGTPEPAHDAARTTRRLTAVGAIIGSLIGASAMGQQTPSSTASDSTELQEVVVTGSLIKRINAETAEPITILKTDSLKELGITNVQDALNQLAANAPAINVASSVGSFSGGGTYANLRDLGSSRTLILLDGQRLANNANTGNAVDLSGLPFSAFETIEVLREGATAEYGSDAIAGVINFKVKKNYQGAEVEVNFDRPQHEGGGNGNVQFTLGHGDLVNDGYNVMLTASYSKQQELRATQRDFSAEGYYPGGGYTSTNNPGTWPAGVVDSNGNSYQSGYPACAGNNYLTRDFGECSYRYSAATDLLPKSSETSGLLQITKALPANNNLQLQYFWTQSEVTGWSGPMFYFFQLNPASPYFPTAGQLTCAGGAANCGGLAPNLTGINQTNPQFLPNGKPNPAYHAPTPVDAVWTDPNNNRYTGNLNVEQRVLLKFFGSNAGWDYEVFGNYSSNTNDNRNVGGYPNEAVLAPGGVLSNLINPFGAQSAAGQSLINSSYINGIYALGKETRWSVDGSASHQLGDAFNSGLPSTVAMGFDVGGERFTYATTPYNDLVSAATGLTDSNVEGTRQTQALFFELDMPMTKRLDVDVSDREDRYSDFGRTNNGKLQVNYKATDFLTLRGTASTGFRAPTLYNLYSPNFLAASSSGTMGSGNPDCVGTPKAPFTAATCNTQGLGLFGGNKNLTPETSQNFNFGIVLQPIEDMGITLDYYRVLVKNTIGAIPVQAIYGNPSLFASQYVLSNTGGLTPSIQEATYCHPYTSATCGYILQNSLNTGRITTDGFDLSIQYSQHTPIGTFHEDLEGTAITKYLLQQYNGGPNLNINGWYNEIPQGGLNVAYKWSQNLRVDWTSPDKMWGAGLDNRLYSQYVDEYPDGAGNQREVGTYTLFDGFASYKPIDALTVVVGIKNLLDRDPPFTNAYQSNFAAGYNALTGDPRGRSFYLDVRYKIF